MKTLRLIFARMLTTHVAWPILLAVAMLCTASLLALQNSSDRMQRQEIFVAAGAAVLIGALIPHFQQLGRLSYVAFGAVAMLLVAVLFTRGIKGAHRWFQVAESLQVQPSELMKLAFVVAVAWYLRYQKNLRRMSALVVPFVLMLIPFGLILVEPDLGTALLFPLALYAMLIAAGAKFRHLISIALILLFAGPGAYPFLKDYQKARITSIGRHWLHVQDSSQRMGGDYQQQGSEMTIGSGGVWGQRDAGAQYVHNGLLPESDTDFIFAVVGIRWGFVGGLCVLILYMAFFAACLEIAGSTRDQFGRLLAVGLSSIILFQALINMAMTIALAPVVGIALPFLSYGGSSLLVNFFAAGIILNVSIRRQGYSAASVQYGRI